MMTSIRPITWLLCVHLGLVVLTLTQDVEGQPEDSDEALAAAALADNRRFAAFFDESLEREPRDMGFADETEAMVQTLFSSEKASRLREVRCQSTFCRAIIEPLDAQSRDQLVSMIPETKPFSYGGFYYIEPEDGTLRLYFQRQGEPLPKFPEPIPGQN